MKKMPLSAQFFLKTLENSKFGLLNMTLPDGKQRSYGEGERQLNIEVRDWEVFNMLLQRGDMGLAEAIIEDRIFVEDQAALVEWACLNDQALGKALYGTLKGTLISQIRRFLAWNSRKGAKKNIMAHYDLGNEFFRLWLDPSMTYSSALFVSNEESLEEAQMRKYDRLIEQLDIRAGDRVLEIGSGWGGFFSRAVEKTGCHVTAVMNSSRQASYNKQLIKKQNMADYVDLKELDYRDIEGQYDKIVSIEMIEAVGESYWGGYFDKISSSLKSRGTAMVQGITIREDLFYSYRKTTDFIQQYIFPGGMLPTNQVIENQSDKNHMKLDSVYEFGLSYAKTLKLWRENFLKRKLALGEMGFSQEFIRLWSFYFSYCEGAFRAQRVNVGQFEMVKV